MGRLIEADKLIDMLLTENQRCVTSTGHELTMNTIVSFINHQPTAYDVDEVVKQLEESINGAKLSCPYNTGWKNSAACAIYIVRRGGISEPTENKETDTR